VLPPGRFCDQLRVADALGREQRLGAETRWHSARVSDRKPPNLSILELATIVGVMPAMGIFNNLIMFDQHVPQVSFAVDCS
jgi:hypothetical protein